MEHIEGDKPVQSYKKPTFPTLAANTIKSMQEQFNIKLLVNYTDATGNQIAVPIKIEDLLNKASLEKWQKQNAPTLPLVNILNSLRNYIGMQTGTKTIKVDQSGQHIPGMGTV